MSKNVQIKFGSEAAAYDIRIDADSLSDVGKWAVGTVDGKTGRVAVVSNDKVFGLYGKQVESSLSLRGFDVSVHLIGDGERFKNMRSLEKVLAFLSENGFSRSDGISCAGGGVVGDLAGFAASVYLRGIRFLQVPTTLLAMIDSSVGGKTAVNTRHGKNLVGTFYQPAGVLIDPQVLRTLPRREMTAGLCEAAKQAVLAGGKTFSGLHRFLDGFAIGNLATLFDDTEFVEMLSDLIAAQVAFKAKSFAATNANRRNVLIPGRARYSTLATRSPMPSKRSPITAI